jgi:hypothetical protein
MTNGHHTKPAPQHGGLQRVQFDGGQTIRRDLPFLAASVNIDNWSPYWYKLNPVEEYIPPFQHGVNIALPLIHDYEFVCQAPPGIQQSTIVPTSGIAGNIKPVIAVFSSLGTNNDAGFNALESSANIGNSFTTFNGATNIEIDLTIYGGLFLSVTGGSRFIVEIQYLDEAGSGLSTTLYRRIIHTNLRILLTIPKITRFVRVLFNSDTNRPVAVVGSYSARPFIGALPFSVQLLSAANASVTPQDSTSNVGETTVNFTIAGLDSCYLTILPNGGAGVTITTAYWIKVFATRASSANQALLYSKVFLNGDTGLNNNGLGDFILPVEGVLSQQYEQLIVAIRPVEAGATLSTAVTDISLHQSRADALVRAAYTPPIPYTLFGTQAPLPAFVWTALTTLPLGGEMISLQVAIYIASPAATGIQFAIGSGVAQSVFIGIAPGTIITTYTLDAFETIRLDNGFNTLWALTGSPVSFQWLIVVK